MEMLDVRCIYNYCLLILNINIWTKKIADVNGRYHFFLICGSFVSHQREAVFLKALFDTVAKDDTYFKDLGLKKKSSKGVY